MAKKKLRVSGSKLKMLARMVESKPVGGMLKKQISKQMGLGAIGEAVIGEHEVPALRPCAVYDALATEGSGTTDGTGGK